ncbi:MAG: YitT family protein, partial [Lentihominibacter sp.]
MGKKIEKDIIRKEFGKYGTICICAFIFALSINLFIVPLGLYSSGVLGIAQILRSLIDDAAGSWIPHSVD